MRLPWMFAVLMLAACDAGIEPSRTRFVTLQANAQYACGSRSERGVLECWGVLPGALVSDGGFTREPRPLEGPARDLVLVRQVADGNVGCGLDREGRAWCWGDNDRAQLGRGFVSSSEGVAPVDTDVRFRDIAPGLESTCALAADGRLFCWGAPLAITPDGAAITCTLGGLFTNPCVPRPVEARLTGGPFEMLAMGQLEAGCVLDAAGQLQCWATDGTFTEAMPPLAEIAASADFSGYDGMLCGRTTDGHVLCSGSNRNGRLGRGAPVPGPFDLELLPPASIAVPAETRIDRFTLGERHGCALDRAGAAWCWGDGDRLGAAINADQAAPVRVLGNLRFRDVAGSCAVEEERGVWCWESDLPVLVAGQGRSY